MNAAVRVRTTNRPCRVRSWPTVQPRSTIAAAADIGSHRPATNRCGRPEPSTTTSRWRRRRWAYTHSSGSVPSRRSDVAITIDIANQIAFVFKGEQLIGVTNVSTGKKGHPTPLGFWTINWKRPMYRSKKYDNAPMPFMQNIDDKGIAIHAGNTPGYPASHGCIRMPMAFAKQLYGLTKPGNKVVIEG